MNTRSDFAMITLASLCIVSSLFFGSLMVAESVERGSQSLGQRPLSVHSVEAHGMTVPGPARVATAQVMQ
jgi:hypothetical protein